MYYTYILKSEKDGRFYYGSCENLEVRLKAHNRGKVRSTKSRRPMQLHYSEVFETRSDARRRELFFKSIDGYRWLKEHQFI